MAKNEKKDDIGKLSFEQAIKELKGIVEKIEQGQIPLQDSLEQYERGMALIKHCKTILQQAEKRIEKITEQQNTEDARQENRKGGKENGFPLPDQGRGQVLRD